LHDLLLSIERLDDYTDEELNEEHANDDDQDHGVENDHWAGVLLWLLVGTDGVNRCPHDINPTFRGLDGNKSQETVQGRVKVEVRGHPLATVVDAVPHRFDILFLLFHAQVEMVSVAGVEAA